MTAFVRVFSEFSLCVFTADLDLMSIQLRHAVNAKRRISPATSIHEYSSEIKALKEGTAFRIPLSGTNNQLIIDLECNV